MDPAWIALIGTLFGGVMLKIAETYLGRSKERVDDAARIRDELRLQITEQKQEIADLEKRLETAIKDYYDLREKHMAIQTELTIALAQLKRQSNGN